MHIHSYVFYAQSRQNYWEMKPKDTGQLDLLLHPNKPSVEKHMTSPNRQHTKEQMNSLKHQLMQSHVCKVQIEEETKC
jgi:hypothetical protein